MKNTDIHRLLSRYYETWAGINAAYDRIAARCGVTSNVLYLLDTLYCAEAPMTQSGAARPAQADGREHGEHA